jgi:putative ABC transport system permease protein
MSGLFQDVRYAVRQLRKSPAFAAIAVLTLALGIGATTAIFSVVDGVLLRPLPYHDPGRIMAIFELTNKGIWNSLADPNFDDFRDQTHSFEAIAKYGTGVVSISGGSQPTRSMAAGVTPGFLKVFDVQPVLGRDLTAADDAQGAAPVALVGYAYWKQYLGAVRDLSRLHLKIDNAVFSVIGVVPAGFEFPRDVAVWVPADRGGENASRTSHNYLAVGRLRDGITPEQANADIGAIAHRIHNTSREQGDFLLAGAVVVPLQDAITRQSRPVLLVLLAAVAFLLLIACANVMNLQLAKAAVRERELAVRSALGASRRRLVRQFITEALLLSAVGGLAGVLAAYFGVDGMMTLAPQNLPRMNEVSISLPVLGFAVLLCTALAIGLGLITALRATSGDVQEGLTEAGRGQMGSQASQNIGRRIVAAQVAITLVLVIGAGLLGRSLMKVLEVNPGFRVDNIVAMDVSLPFVGWTDLKARAGEAIFYRDLIDRLKQIPGVRTVGAASRLPMEEGGLPNGMFVEMSQQELPKQPDDLAALTRELDILFRQKDRTLEADFCVASEGYFQALEIPLLRGRMFDDRDGPESPPVALISESLTRKHWLGRDAIGRTLELGGMDGDTRLATIVGIVGDVHEYGLDLPPRPTIYVDLFQRPRPWMTVTMLSGANTGAVTSAARAILHELNPEIPPRFRTFSQVYSESLGSRRFTITLVGLFAGIALFLATAGVYGVTAYSVSRRTREIGVRMALGARPADVLAMVLRQGLRTVLIGIIIGFAGSLAVTRAIQSLLFGVRATDPLTFAAVAALLIAAAWLACWFPARRAAKVDPMVALRYE